MHVFVHISVAPGQAGWWGEFLPQSALSAAQLPKGGGHIPGGVQSRGDVALSDVGSGGGGGLGGIGELRGLFQVE